MQLRAKVHALPGLEARIPATCAALEQAMADVSAEQLMDHPKQSHLRKLLASISIVQPVSIVSA